MAIELECGQCRGRLQAEQPGSVVACPHCGAHLHVPEETETQDVVPIAESESRLEDEPGFEGPHAEGENIERDQQASGSTHSHPQNLPPSAFPLPPSSVPAATVPRSLFLLVASYASALTLAFLFLLMQYLFLPTHRLESLPDVVPEIRNGEVALQVAPPEASVPPGHVLALGESRRFGSVKVTPLRVTQGSLSFEHALNDSTAERPPSGPVLKLWLRFENVSRDQRFSPLDPILLFKRHYQEFGERELTNQFLCQADQRQSDGRLHHVYELSATSEFRIAGQQLDSVLGPGESLETFVPSEEAINELTGDLVWRIQFRKGYHPRTRHGVTTLIDVPFRRDDVKIES